MRTLPYQHAGDVGRDEDGEEQDVAEDVPPLLRDLPHVPETELVDGEGDGETAVEAPGGDGAEDDWDDDGQEDAGHPEP